MTEVLSLRVDDDLAEWATAYAKSRGVSRQALLEQAVRSFKEDCDSGVPEIQARARRQATVREVRQGVGDCSKREGDLGHVWADVRVDPRRACVYCGEFGRGDDQKGELGFMASAGAERAEMFQSFKIPMQNGTGDPAKAWPKGMPPEMRARAEAVVADKKRRGAEEAS